MEMDCLEIHQKKGCFYKTPQFFTYKRFRTAWDLTSGRLELVTIVGSSSVHPPYQRAMGNYAKLPGGPVFFNIVIFCQSSSEVYYCLLSWLSLSFSKTTSKWCHNLESIYMSSDIWMAETDLVHWLGKVTPYWTCQLSILCNFLLWR